MRNSLSITVAVADGRLQPTDQQKRDIAAFLAKRETIAVKFSKPTVLRNLKQNSYYWLLLTEIAQHTGNTAEDLHHVFKDKLLPRKFVHLGDKEIELRKSTTDLSVAEFQSYLEQVRAFASTELHLNLPENMT